MKTLFVTILIMLFVFLLALPASAQYSFEITTEMSPEWKCINWRVIEEAQITWEMDDNGDKVIYAATDIPAPLGLTDKTIHNWYIPVELANLPDNVDEAYYGISYDAVAVGAFPSETVFRIQPGGSIHVSFFRLKIGLMDWSRPQMVGVLKKRTGQPVPKK